MSFQIPTLTNLVERARNAFRVNLPGSDAWLFPNNIGPTAKVIGGLTSEAFSFADYIQRQKFALTADGENLDNHATELGLARRPAAPASGTITLTTTDAVSVAAAAQFQRSDGFVYLATAPVSIGGAGSLDVPVIAELDGSNGQAISGTPITIVSGVTGDASAAVGADGVAGGLDVEADGDYYTTDFSTLRGRVLFRKRYPPHGGAPSDYVQWATEVSGVTRVFVERTWSGGGTVRVFFTMDDTYADGIPQAADVQRVFDHIETVRPASAIVTVAAPIATPINHAITLVPDNNATEEAVRAELRAAIRRLGRVAGGDTSIGALPFLATPFTWSRSWSGQAVSNAAGEVSNILTAPAADTAITSGHIPTLGTVTFP